MTRELIIAIDGPSGAGKGTIARAVAARLQYRHIDTGAMYRAVAWKALQQGVDIRDEAATAAIAERAAFELDQAPGVHRWSRRDPRDPHAGDRRRRGARRAASGRAARAGRAPAEPRDRRRHCHGRTRHRNRVFPDADIKIFLDASPEERARRRANDPAHRASERGRRSAMWPLRSRNGIGSTRPVLPRRSPARPTRITSRRPALASTRWWTA